MRVRRVEFCEELVRLDALIFPEDERITDEPYCEWWLIRDTSGKPVGYCGLKWRLPKDRDAGFLMRAGVVYSCRGHGLQKRMIDARVRRAKELGLRILITYTVLDNPASSNSLISRGFRLYTPQWAYAGKVLYFVRELR